MDNVLNFSLENKWTTQSWFASRSDNASLMKVRTDGHPGALFQQFSFLFPCLHSRRAWRQWSGSTSSKLADFEPPTHTRPWGVEVVKGRTLKFAAGKHVLNLAQGAQEFDCQFREQNCTKQIQVFKVIDGILDHSVTLFRSNLHVLLLLGRVFGIFDENSGLGELQSDERLIEFRVCWVALQRVTWPGSCSACCCSETEACIRWSPAAHRWIAQFWGRWWMTSIDTVRRGSWQPAFWVSVFLWPVLSFFSHELRPADLVRTWFTCKNLSA